MPSKRLPDVLTLDEQQTLLKQPNPRYPTGERNRLLMALMLDTGLRLAETIHLQWAHVDMLRGKIRVENGKGGKDANLWTHADNLASLQKWRDRQEKVLAERGHPEPAVYVFTTLDGGPLHPRYVERMVKRYALKAGLTKDVYPHLLRHCFGTDLYRFTKDILVTQRGLRHGSVKTTQIYAHIVDDEVEAAMTNFRAPVGAALGDRR
jgi:integrase/recombinase XerD